MAKIESKITVKVSNVEELQKLERKLERNLTRAEHLNEELAKVLKDIQKTKFTITTEANQLSNFKSTEDESSDIDKENCIADSIIYQLNNYDLGYSNWMHIISKIEHSYSPYPITSTEKDG